MYVEGMGFRAIGQVLGISNVTVLKWVRACGQEIERLREAGAPPKMAMIDEMWHFVQKQTENSGCGAPVTLSAGQPWSGCWVGVMIKPCENPSRRSAT